MTDTIDEIKSNLPVETTAAYAAVVALQDGPAGNMGIMLFVFLFLLAATAALVIAKTNSLYSILIAVAGFIVWVVNIDSIRFSNIIVDFYQYYISTDSEIGNEILESMETVFRITAILFSVFLAIASTYRARRDLTS